MSVIGRAFGVHMDSGEEPSRLEVVLPFPEVGLENLAEDLVPADGRDVAVEEPAVLQKTAQPGEIGGELIGGEVVKGVQGANRETISAGSLLSSVRIKLQPPGFS